MVKIKDNEFIKLDFDLYANDKLVQTTEEKKGKEAGLNIEKYGPQTIIVGKGFVLKALDEDIVKNTQIGETGILELKPKEAYGMKNKKLIKVLPKSAFDEHKMRPVVGVVYDFNGTYGTVKSIVGGRVMVDFNNPLSGKNIRIEYKVLSKVNDIDKKILNVFESILRIPNDMCNVKVKEKIVIIGVPEQIIMLKDHIIKSLNDFIGELKDYSVKIETFKKE